MARFWCLSILSFAAALAAIDVPGAAASRPVWFIAENFLQPHNDARAAVRVPPLVWNSTLESHAMMYGNRLCGHCDRPLPAAWSSEKTYGQNLYRGKGYQTEKEVVEAWVDGRRWYDRRANACAAGKVICAAYMQVMWRYTRQLGCSRRRCSHSHDTVSVYLYSPPGTIRASCPTD